MVYTLGRRGTEVLEVSMRKKVGDPYIDHQLMIGNFRVALALAAQKRGVILSWRTVGDLPVRPDGFFSLQFPDRPEGRNRAFFFLEADRSTMSRERFLKKLLGYWEWFSRGGPIENLGIKRFRVLTVTKSEERLASLLGAVARVERLGAVLPMFWFSSETRLRSERPESIFDQIWDTPGELGRGKSILPDPAG